MKKVIVKNQVGIETHGAEMEDPSAWIAQCIASNLWGLPERPELDAEGNPTGNTLPAEYTIEIIDITAQIEQEKINAEALAYLASTDWMIIREVDSGVICPSDVKAERAAARAKIVR
ncbi:MAG: hypothetical protein EBU90_27990 [Proteobacteria bacterium]|nr:hypothetical protein [Pseudomonadota bacterium]